MKSAIQAFKADQATSMGRDGWHTKVRHGITVLWHRDRAVLTKELGSVRVWVDPADPAWRAHRRVLLAFGIHAAKCPTAPGFVLVGVAPCAKGKPGPVGAGVVWTTHEPGPVTIPADDTDTDTATKATA